MPLQLYEAVVTNGAPSGAPPGHIKCRIPELFGEDEVPMTIAPLYPGWSAGGWHSVPSQTVPRAEESSDDFPEVRVIIVKVATHSYRWMGTSQGFNEVEESPGVVCGARSGDGDHFMLLSNTAGISLFVSSDQDRDGAKNYISIAPDDTIRGGTFDGNAFGFTKDQIYLLNRLGDALILDAENGIQLVHNGGGEGIFMEPGLLKIIGADVQITPGAMTVTSSSVTVTSDITGAAPTFGAILSDAFIIALKVAIDDIVTGLAAIPYTATAAAAFSATLVPPSVYQSTILKHN